MSSLSRPAWREPCPAQRRSSLLCPSRHGKGWPQPAGHLLPHSGAALRGGSDRGGCSVSGEGGEGRGGSCSLAAPPCGVQVKGPQYLLHVERLRQPGLLILEKKRGKGVSSIRTDDLNGQSERARFFVLVPGDRRGGSGHSRTQGMLFKHMTRLACCHERWHRLPRGL